MAGSRKRSRSEAAQPASDENPQAVTPEATVEASSEEPIGATTRYLLGPWTADPHSTRGISLTIPFSVLFGGDKDKPVRITVETDDIKIEAESRPFVEDDGSVTYQMP